MDGNGFCHRYRRDGRSCPGKSYRRHKSSPGWVSLPDRQLHPAHPENGSLRWDHRDRRRNRGYLRRTVHFLKLRGGGGLWPLPFFLTERTNSYKSGVEENHEQTRKEIFWNYWICRD